MPPSLPRQMLIAAGDRKRYQAMGTTLTLVTPPANEIITTAEAKSHLRVDHSNDDTLIAALVVVARASAEAWTERSFLNTTWDYSLDEAAIDNDWIELPRSPLSSITSITSYGDDNSGTAFSSSSYYAVTNGAPGRVSLVDGSVWPTDLRNLDSMVIRFVAGWGAAIANVPDQYEEWIKRAVLLTVAAMYENRGDVRPGGAFTFGLTDMSKQILQPLRVLHV